MPYDYRLAYLILKRKSKPILITKILVYTLDCHSMNSETRINTGFSWGRVASTRHPLGTYVPPSRHRVASTCHPTLTVSDGRTPVAPGPERPFWPQKTPPFHGGVVGSQGKGSLISRCRGCVRSWRGVPSCPDAAAGRSARIRQCTASAASAF